MVAVVGVDDGDRTGDMVWLVVVSTPLLGEPEGGDGGKTTSEGSSRLSECDMSVDVIGEGREMKKVVELFVWAWMCSAAWRG
jgi:hypothetical protein